jgi:hypothetical protein
MQKASLAIKLQKPVAINLPGQIFFIKLLKIIKNCYRITTTKK